ncbi:MAG: nucleotide exchange factor GrpE [Patescibacteria group bacterium]|nr:nucleotide exchange factor GrpE [Patescibacteria group bacterium]MDD5490574.1 nucleotide exchange factor GrpE [Patescibacteria group bacterium]
MADEDKKGAKQDNAKSELDELREKVVKLEKRAEENLDGWKRAKADYINLKREAEEKQKELIKFVTANILFGLLPIIDSFKKAITHIPEEQKDVGWVAGIFQTKKQIDDFLKGLGLEEIKTVGEKFNPEWHEAVGKRKEEGKEPDIILEEVGSGYKMGDKALIPAKVVVAE